MVKDGQTVTTSRVSVDMYVHLMPIICWQDMVKLETADDLEQAIFWLPDNLADWVKVDKKAAYRGSLAIADDGYELCLVDGRARATFRCLKAAVQ